jgi:tetratricopeptide (TPR) repeat protein
VIIVSKRNHTGFAAFARRFGRGMLAAMLCSLPAGLAVAHHSPSDVIEALSVAMEERGPSAPLLVQRAFEYRALGDDKSAEADLLAALERQPNNLDATIGIARVTMNAGRLADAESYLKKALDQGLDDSAAAPFHAVFAELREQQSQWEDALTHWQRALRSKHPEVDWFLHEGDMLGQLGRVDEALEALETAKQRNASAVIHRAWLMALVDAGRFAAARFHIESELAASRWKSSWLLMRARLNAASGQAQAAAIDAQLALDEIALRKNPARPDPFLLVDESYALALLGEPAEAQARLHEARELDVPEAAMRHARAAIAEGMISKR